MSVHPTDRDLEAMLERCKKCVEPADENQRLPECCTDLPAVVKELQEARGLLGYFREENWTWKSGPYGLDGYCRRCGAAMGTGHVGTCDYRAVVAFLGDAGGEGET